MMRLDHDRALLDRLHERLAAALRQRPDPYGTPVTVAEIYQELVPYRSLRAEAGFAMNADYEHALLRLLSGEGGRAKLEPETARELIARELRATNPNVSIYREYAGCDVWITPPAGAATQTAEHDMDGDDDRWFTDDSADVGDEADAGVSESFTLLELSVEDELDTPPPPPPTPRGSSSGEDLAEAPPGLTQGLDSAQAAAARYAAARQTTTPAADAATCVFCDSRLPTGRKVRFCPFCGGDQSMRPCGECGDALEPGWNFCIACGAAAEAS